MMSYVRRASTMMLASLIILLRTQASGKRQYNQIFSQAAEKVTVTRWNKPRKFSGECSIKVISPLQRCTENNEISPKNDSPFTRV